MDGRRRKLLLGSGASGLGLALFGLRGFAAASPAPAGAGLVVHSDDEWRKLLTPDQYDILRREGTERPYTSPLNNEHRAGIFACAGCAQELFSSTTKFDSGTGWPSFFKPLPNAISTRTDRSAGMERIEVHCARCAGHLGHVFDDGPPPTGLRYCMNGAAMSFKPSQA